jgi:hypothetical protein
MAHLTTLEAIGRQAAAVGLAMRGAFHPEPGEFAALLPAAEVGTVVLLGFTGRLQCRLPRRWLSRPGRLSRGSREPLRR